MWPKRKNEKWETLKIKKGNTTQRKKRAPKKKKYKSARDIT